MENHIPFKVDENLSHIDFGFNTRYYSTMNIQCILYKMSEKDGEYEIEKELYASNETTQHHHRIWITPENQGYWTFVISNPNEIATKAGVYAIAFKKENK